MACALAWPLERATAQTADSSYHATPGRDTTRKLTFGGFVDTYHAWDFDRPHTFDRAFTTQPARYAEFNVNLAYLETKVTGPRYRGRFAAQWGTSVQSNYFNEPRNGIVSGPSVSQFIQEATAGYQLGPTLWIDGGIFFAHVGYESWISRDNLTYTRSMVADFSPYYESGVKFTWTPSRRVTTTFAAVNGWQVISAENESPGGGIRIDYYPNAKVTLTYDNYVGNSAPDTIAARTRFYHDVILQYNPDDRWQLATVYAIGTQNRSTSRGGTASWWGTTTIAKYHASKTAAIVGRFESYRDPSQVIVSTNLPNAFKTMSASLGLDVNFRQPVLWRTEIRGYRSVGNVWPLHTIGDFGGRDGFVVTSLDLTF